MAALAHGMAIVTTGDSGQGAVDRNNRLPSLENEKNCVLVPPDDPQAIADAVQRVMASPELRARIGAGARALAQHFTWDKIAREHLTLYQSII